MRKIIENCDHSSLPDIAQLCCVNWYYNHRKAQIAIKSLANYKSENDKKSVALLSCVNVQQLTIHKE